MQRPYHVGNRAVDDMGTGLHCGLLQDAGHVWLHERVPSMRNAVAQLCRVLPCCLHHGVRRNISFRHNDGISYILRQLATDEPVCHSADDDSLRHSIFHDEDRPSSGSVPVAEGCRLHRPFPLERVPDIRHVDVHLRRALRLVDEQHYMAGHGHNACVFAAALCRSKFHEKPYLPLSIFKFRSVQHLMLLLLGVGILQAAPKLLQSIYLSSVLKYDSLNTISLNWPILYGVVVGSLLAFATFVKWHWGFKKYFIVALVLLTFYEVSMYFLIDGDTNREAFFIPLFAFGVSEVMIGSASNVYLSQSLPFSHFSSASTP